MTKTLILAAGAALVFQAAPAMAQAVQPPGVIPPGGPLTADDPYDTTNLIANGHGTHGRIDSDAREARRFRDRMEAYLEETAARREEAVGLRDRMMSGEEVVVSRSRIRSALQEDMELWRDTFDISRDGWRAMRDQWLVDLGAANSVEWVLRRANWFEARDAWMSQQLAILEGDGASVGG